MVLTKVIGFSTTAGTILPQEHQAKQRWTLSGKFLHCNGVLKRVFNDRYIYSHQITHMNAQAFRIDVLCKSGESSILRTAAFHSQSLILYQLKSKDNQPWHSTSLNYKAKESKRRVSALSMLPIQIRPSTLPHRRIGVSGLAEMKA